MRTAERAGADFGEEARKRAGVGGGDDFLCDWKGSWTPN
jgi:hypothetical protein